MEYDVGYAQTLVSAVRTDRKDADASPRRMFDDIIPHRHVRNDSGRVKAGVAGFLDSNRGLGTCVFHEGQGRSVDESRTRSDVVRVAAELQMAAAWSTSRTCHILCPATVTRCTNRSSAISADQAAFLIGCLAFWPDKNGSAKLVGLVSPVVFEHIAFVKDERCIFQFAQIFDDASYTVIGWIIHRIIRGAFA